jgi:uncharacterized protein (TIGR03083 family)
LSDAAVLTAAAALRRELADLLEALTPAQLDTPSLCGGWSCRVVAGHLHAAQLGGRLPMVRAMLRVGPRFHAVSERVSQEAARRPVAELAQAFRARADTRVSVPVVGIRGPLADLAIHLGDIRVPLGLPHEVPVETAELVLDFLAGGAPMFVRRSTVEGLLLQPDDTARTWGSGTPVTGRAVDLVLAISGRAAVLPALSGPGAVVLAERLGR